MPPAALPGAKLLKSLTNVFCCQDTETRILHKNQSHLSGFLKSGPPEGPPEATSRHEKRKKIHV
jgi:hypothetical protein